jgi:hypothetical protein
MMGEIFKLFGTIGLNNKDANKGIDETTGKAESAGTKISGFFKKAAGAIGAAFAAQKLVSFGKMTVEAAASAKAIQAQFEQVFGGSQTQASDAINGMAQQFGMLPNRIKPSFTATTSMFKGLGLSTEEAMAQATNAVTLASDAAAFYDMSYENANSALSSFIKGNYEGGEAIGLFANETQLASWASENLGVEWSELGEADKQIARMQFAQTMQEAAGATGQAARESDSYENQLGNMKQAWSDFAALVGAPILDIAVQGLQTVTGWLQTAGEKVQDFQTWFGDLKTEITESVAWETLKTVMQPVFDAIQTFKDNMADSTFLSDMATKFGEIKDAVLGIDFVKLKDDFQTFVDTYLPIIAGIGGTVAVFAAISGGIALVNGAIALGGAISAAASLGYTAVGVAILSINWPLVALAAAIAVAIAAGVWLWQNWDMVKAKAIEIWGAIKEFFTVTLANIVSDMVTKATEMKDKFVAKIVELKTNAVNHFNEMKDSMKQKIAEAVSDVVSKATEMKNNFVNEVTEIKNSVVSKFQEIKDGINDKVRSTVSSVGEKFGEVYDKIMDPVNRAKEAVKTAIDKIKGFFDFSWSLPSLKMPKISISGEFSLKPLSVPSFGISWHKDGGIFEKATLFDTASGMHGVGEAGPEAIIPLNRETLGGIGQGIASAMGWGNEYIAQKLDAIIDLIAEFLSGYDPNTQLVMDTGALVGEIRSEMDKQLGNDYRLRGRGR